MSHLPLAPKKIDLTIKHTFKLLSSQRIVAEFKTFRAMANQKQILLGQIKISDPAFRGWVKSAVGKSARKDLLIQEFDSTGKLLATINVANCWVSEFSSLSELDAAANAVVIESLILETEGWERDDKPS